MINYFMKALQAPNSQDQLKDDPEPLPTIT